MKKLIYIIVCFLAIYEYSYAQVPAPVADQAGPILLLGGTAHIGDGTIIEQAAIAFEDGKLTLVADSRLIKIDMGEYEVLDVSGKHVYPGFILPNSQLGLLEVNNIRSTNDTQEEGDMNPNVRSIIAYNTDSENIPTMRFNGVLLAEITPRGGRISGTSSVVEMEGWNWEDAAHTVDMAMHLNWPSKSNRRFDFATFTVQTTENKGYGDDVEAWNALVNDAKAYGALSTKPVNLKLEKMQGLFDGSLTLMIHASDPKEIIESVQSAMEHGIRRMAVVTGDAALHVASFLKSNGVPVVIEEVHALPGRPDDDIDMPYKLPHLLTEAGLKVSLAHSGMLAHARNLPFYAGTAVAYGMSKEEALKTITSNTADILGIADRVGTLEAGKDATLFVSEGDALDIRTNQLLFAFISGKNVTLDNKQQELYKRYSKKYGHMD